MGWFRRAGRRAGRNVERFKQSAEAIAQQEVTHVCADCGTRFYTEHDACPECGGPVEPVEPDE